MIRRIERAVAGAPASPGCRLRSFNHVRAPLDEGDKEPIERIGMLCVPTFVAPSTIAGVGLHAATDLPVGTIIWQFTEGVDWRLAPEELEAFPEPFRSRMRHYLYQEDSGNYILCGDNAKFMNHADDPNCEDPDGEYTITLRHVRAGEELTCDYRQFDLPSRLHGMAFPEEGAMPDLLRMNGATARHR